MDYPSALQYLESLIDYERTPAEARNARFFNLERMEMLLERLGNPHRYLTCVHIAGTKGKGSTAAMSASILCAAGKRTGLYTSPHLVSFRERIRIDGAAVPESAVTALTAQLQPHIETMRGGESGTPSFFEAYTAMALLYFQEQEVDAAVIETGLGGRLDATNVITPKVCGITTIAMDHTQELGGTLAAIAAEKAGIIKPGVPVVCAPQGFSAMQVITEVCRRKQARLIRVGPPRQGYEVSVETSRAGTFQRLSIADWSGFYEEVTCPLLGEHQAWNAGVAAGMMAVLAEQGFGTGERAIRAGLQQVCWPGRLQIIEGAPTVVLDGAHDVASATALNREMHLLFPFAEVTLVLGISSDKDIQGIAQALSSLPNRVILTAAKSPRAAKAEELRRALSSCFAGAQIQTSEDVASALKSAGEQTPKQGLILVTGSLYVVGEAMQALGVLPL
jgi:dihydrofolate synthase/folylpolyglutamate synthase